MVVQMKVDPKWVWDEKVNHLLVRDGEVDGKPVTHIRLPDWKEAERQKVIMKNYKSLDDHIDLILFEGWIDKRSKKVHLEDKRKAASRVPYVKAG